MASGRCDAERHALHAEERYDCLTILYVLYRGAQCSTNFGFRPSFVHTISHLS